MRQRTKLNRTRGRNRGPSLRKIWQAVRERDVTCRDRGPDCEIDQHLNVHHIDEDRQNNALDNLVLLCKNCHCTRHNWRVIGCH